MNCEQLPFSSNFELNDWTGGLLKAAFKQLLLQSKEI